MILGLSRACSAQKMLTKKLWALDFLCSPARRAGSIVWPKICKPRACLPRPKILRAEHNCSRTTLLPIHWVSGLAGNGFFELLGSAISFFFGSWVYSLLTKILAESSQRIPKCSPLAQKKMLATSLYHTSDHAGLPFSSRKSSPKYGEEREEVQ